MTLERAFLRWNIALVAVSVLSHEVAAGQYLFLALALAVCGAVLYYDHRGQPLHVSNRLATLLALVIFLLTVVRSLGAHGAEGMQMLDLEVPSLGRFLIAFACLAILRKKTPRDYVWLYLVTVILMGIAGLLLPGVGYAPLFLLYAFTGLCTLSMYTAWLEALEAGPDTLRTARIPRRYVFAALPMTLALMGAVAVVFAALPRRAAAAPITAQLVRTVGVRPVTGFDERVRLGQLGAIQQNPERAMRMRAFNADTGEPLELSGVLLRGVALDRYAAVNGRWEWQISEEAAAQIEDFTWGGGDVSRAYRSAFPAFAQTPGRRVRFEIELEPLRTNVVFAPFAAEEIRIYRDRVLKGNRATHHFFAHPRRSPMREYTVISRLLEPTPHTGRAEDPPTLARRWREMFLALPADLSPRIRDTARRLCPETEALSDYAKAARILNYLSDSGRFTYTLQQDPTPGVEPIEDFLFNRPMGHCEYFASAMVVMLRAVSVPARVVTGFKVAEFNPIGGHFIIRQSDAHAWVEAYLEPEGWRSFDPSVMREAVAGPPPFVRRWWRNLYDTAEGLWVRHVLNYDAEAQAKFYGVFTRLADAMNRVWIRTMLLAGAESLRFSRWETRALLRLLRDVLLVLGSGLAALLLALWLHRVLRRRSVRRTPAGAAALLYRRMERLLEHHGFGRPEWMTPWEFHGTLAEAGWAPLEPVTEVTTLYYDVRFGGRDLTPGDRARAEDALRRLRRCRIG